MKILFLLPFILLMGASRCNYVSTTGKYSAMRVEAIHSIEYSEFGCAEETVTLDVTFKVNAWVECINRDHCGKNYGNLIESEFVIPTIWQDPESPDDPSAIFTGVCGNDFVGSVIGLNHQGYEVSAGTLYSLNFLDECKLDFDLSAFEYLTDLTLSIFYFNPYEQGQEERIPLRASVPFECKD
jgi:hypothetical protein